MTKRGKGVSRLETRDSSEGGLERHFESRTRLAKLLEKAGSVVAPDEVAEGFKQAQADGLSPKDVIPALFDGEPRFEKTSDARELYSNLLGLWDLVASGAKVDLAAPPPREKAPKPQPLPPPPPFEGQPDAAWVDAAWKSLESANAGELTRLWHAFDNRQDALVQWMEEQATRVELSDAAFGAARDGAFQLFAMLHRSREKGWPRVQAEEFEIDAVRKVPEALSAFTDELLFDVETDEALLLPKEESAQVRRLVSRALEALWGAGT